MNGGDVRSQTRRLMSGRHWAYTFAALIFVAVIVLAVSYGGVDGNKSTDGPNSGASGTCDLDYVTKQIDDRRGIADWAYPGDPFDAKKAAGKAVFTIQENSTNPFTNTIVAGMKDVADKIGIKLVNYPNQGQRTQ
jgi:ribose transport system substrate-binding protein